MLKRIVEISQSGSYLSVRYGQLVIRRDGEQAGRIPCEDIGVLLVDHSGVTYTHTVFTELLSKGAAVVLCGGDHHPSGMFLPVESNSLQSERYRYQVEAKEPVKKRLWKQIVRAKIRHQACVLGRDNEQYSPLMGLREKVKSGDTSNVEAQASKRYWAEYFSDLTDPSAGLGMTTLRRDTNGSGVNILLNYGYMVLRASVARAICSAGLLPTLGLHHRNRYNAYCLADDMMEPFRGFVEKKVRTVCREGWVGELDQQTKAKLLEVLYEPVTIRDFKGPLMVALHRTTASLVRVFEGTQKEVDLPKL